jgi:hypothetical protein
MVSRQLKLQLEAVHVAEMHVDDETGGALEEAAVENLLARGECFNREASRFDQAPERPPHCWSHSSARPGAR